MLLLLALSRPDPRPMRTPMVHMRKQIRVRAAGVFRCVGVGAVVTLLCRYPGCIDHIRSTKYGAYYYYGTGER